MFEEKKLILFFIAIGAISLLASSYYTYRISSYYNMFLHEFHSDYVSSLVCEKNNGRYVMFDESVFVVCNYVDSLYKYGGDKLCEKIDNENKRSACVELFRDVYDSVYDQCYNVTHIEELANETGLGVLNLIDKGYIPKKISFDEEKYIDLCNEII